MKALLKLLIISTFLITSAHALKKEEIKTIMDYKIQNIVKIIQDKKIQNGQKAKEIVQIIDDVFDYKLMARIALGKKTWVSISKDKQNEFVEVFENKLKKSYLDKLELYTNEKIRVIDLVTYKKSRLQLETEIIGKDDIYKVNYNFYYNKRSKEWFIYDVDLIGVSIIQTYRQQFSGLLKDKTFDEMLTILKESNDKKDIW